jgi:hypothetical protein
MVYPSGQGYIATTENLGICTLPVNQSRDRISLGHCGKEIYHINHGFRPQRIMYPEVWIQNASNQWYQGYIDNKTIFFVNFLGNPGREWFNQPGTIRKIFDVAYI